MASELFKRVIAWALLAGALTVRASWARVSTASDAMKKIMCLLPLAVLFIVIPARCHGKTVGSMTIYIIDVGSGNACLIVSPSGQSMLVDTGSPDVAKRVLEVIRQAGVKQIDYMVVSHYHGDHYGGVPYLAQNIRIVNFVDHGFNVEYGKSYEWWKERRGKAPGFHRGFGQHVDGDYDSYEKVLPMGHHIVVKAGDTVPVQGVDVAVVTAAGQTVSRPLQGAGNPNPACADVNLRAEDDAEDAQSIGLLVTYGKFRFINLGDLTWDVSYRLFCPDNKVGTADAYMITHHGQSLKESLGPYYWGISCCSKAEVYGLHSEVAILSLGPASREEMGSGDALKLVKSTPGLKDVWQTNYITGGLEKEYNAPKEYCANIGTTDDQPEFIKLVADPSGSFTVTNSRNGYTQHYSK